jgi:hypothetical protein
MTKLDELVELRQTSHEAARKAVGPHISISLKNILVPTAADLRSALKT